MIEGLGMTAEAIRAGRKAARLTQEQLARELGVTVTSVSRWERGQVPSALARAVLRQFFEKAEAEQSSAA